MVQITALKPAEIEGVLDYTEHDVLVFEEEATAQKWADYCDRNELDYLCLVSLAEVGYDRRFHGNGITYHLVKDLRDNTFGMFISSDYSVMSEIMDEPEVKGVLEALFSEESYEKFINAHPIRAISCIQDAMKQFNIAEIKFNEHVIRADSDVVVETYDNRGVDYPADTSIVALHDKNDFEQVDYNPQISTGVNHTIYRHKTSKKLYLQIDSAWQGAPDYEFVAIDELPEWAA